MYAGAPGGMQNQLMNAHHQLLNDIMEMDRHAGQGGAENGNELDAIEQRIRAIQEQLDIFRRRDEDIHVVEHPPGGRGLYEARMPDGNAQA